MSAIPGWYPDPAGQPAHYRYWDGQAWSPQTTPNPAAPPPGRPDPPPGSPPSAAPGPPRRSRAVWWVAGVALLLVAVVVAVLVLRPGGSEIVDGPVPAPPSTNVCPDAVEDSAAPPPVFGDRVTSGSLSYPLLPPPFREPGLDSRVPFGRNVRYQDAIVEADAAGAATWVASVLIAQLLAGDGFYGPEQGAKVVADCAVGKFYGDTPAGREDRRNEAITVDGRPAWLIESHLTFAIPDIRTTGELMIIVVIDTGVESGLFYASIPDTSPEFVEPARAALAQLQVSS